MSLLSVLALTLPALAAMPPSAAGKANGVNVLLIGWDGVGRSRLKQALKLKQLPNLQALIDKGTLVNIEVTSGATDTKAGWSQVLTGCRPTVTGIYSNRYYRPIPRGLTIFERLKKSLGNDGIFTAALIASNPQDCDNGPERQRIDQPTPAAMAIQTSVNPYEKFVVENGQWYGVHPGKPLYNARAKIDVWNNKLKADDKVTSAAIDALSQANGRRFFFYVHLLQVDHQGHAFGENSTQYHDAIINCDVQLGRIVAKLASLKLLASTKIYVTADHGFDTNQNTHKYAPHIFLATNDRAVTGEGTRADIAPTILQRMGLDIAALQPGVDGKSLLGGQKATLPPGGLAKAKPVAPDAGPKTATVVKSGKSVPISRDINPAPRPLPATRPA